jgi:ribosomal protein S27E
MIDKLIQPKRLYCTVCDVLLLPDFNLSCPVCGTTLTTCWWALLNRKTKVKEHCKDCQNRFWCWTHKAGDEKRLPTVTQAQIVQNAKFGEKQ